MGIGYKSFVLKEQSTMDSALLMQNEANFGAV